MKRTTFSAVLLLIMLTVMTLAFSGCADTAAKSGETADNTETTGSEAAAAEAETTAAQLFSHLDITVSRGNLYIRSGDSFSVTRDEVPVDYRLENQVLYITIVQDGDTILTLPTGSSYTQLTLSVTEGHVSCEAALQLETLALNASKSEVTLDTVAVTGSTALQIEQGSAFLSGDLGPQVTAVCHEGHLTLDSSAEQEQYNYALSLTEGDIRLDETEYHDKSRTWAIDHGSTRSMTLTSVRSDLSVTFP